MTDSAGVVAVEEPTVELGGPKSDLEELSCMRCDGCGDGPRKFYPGLTKIAVTRTAACWHAVPPCMTAPFRRPEVTRLVAAG